MADYLIALIFGVVGRGRARRHEATNGGVAAAGLIIGLVGIVLGFAMLIFGLLVGFSFLNSPAGRSYTDCLSYAQNAHDRDECHIDFQRRIIPTR